LADPAPSDYIHNMPRATAKRTSQPVIPEVSAETWKALLAAADEFHRLAPWEWMHDAHVVGLRHPVTREILLGSVLGQLRSVFALLVYRGAAGHRWLINTILNQGSPSAERNMAFEQDLVKAEFVPKRELDDSDRAILAAGNYVPTKKRGAVWPQFRSFVPGHYPWPVTQTEAETLFFALPRVAAVARLLQTEAHVWDDHCRGEIGFVPDDFDPAAGPLRADQLQWHPMIPAPDPIPQSVTLDAATMTRLSKLPAARGFHLELDLGYSPFSIADGGRPRFPRLAMAVDGGSGMVGGFHLSSADDTDGAAALAVVLKDTLKQFGHRPEIILVQQPRVATMLADVAAELHVPVQEVVELPGLNQARAHMEQTLGRFQ
jgi:hypothetical protein